MQATKSVITLAAISAIAAGLAGCASTPYYGTNYYPTAPGSAVTTTVASVQPVGLVEYGRITNMQQITTGTGNPTAASTIVGDVGGINRGTMVGSDSGRAPTTVMGASGGTVVTNGAVVTNLLADGRLHSMQGPISRLTVTTDAGAQRQYDVPAASNLQVGDRVRLDNGAIYSGYFK